MRHVYSKRRIKRMSLDAINRAITKKRGYDIKNGKFGRYVTNNRNDVVSNIPIYQVDAGDINARGLVKLACYRSCIDDYCADDDAVRVNFKKVTFIGPSYSWCQCAAFLHAVIYEDRHYNVIDASKVRG